MGSLSTLLTARAPIGATGPAGATGAGLNGASGIQGATGVGINGATGPAGTSGGITSGTTQASTSGTSIDFTGIPSGVKRITVMFNGVSTNGTSVVQVRLGTASGIEATGYSGASATVQGTTSCGVNSTGLNLMNGNAAFVAFYGQMTISLLGANTYVSQHALGNAESISTVFLGGGAKTLGGTLTQLRITTANGTDAFDAGSINILYE
jgi:hypothetical protein